MAAIDRIKEFQKLENISNYALEKSLGLSNGYMAKCKNPSSDILENILSKYPRLSAEWLMRGVGEMYLDKPAVQEQSTTAKLDEALKEIDLKELLLKDINLREVIRQEVEDILKKEA